MISKFRVLSVDMSSVITPCKADAPSSYAAALKKRPQGHRGCGSKLTGLEFRRVRSGAIRWDSCGYEHLAIRGSCLAYLAEVV